MSGTATCTQFAFKDLVLPVKTCVDGSRVSAHYKHLYHCIFSPVNLERKKMVLNLFLRSPFGETMLFACVFLIVHDIHVCVFICLIVCSTWTGTGDQTACSRLKYSTVTCKKKQSYQRPESANELIQPWTISCNMSVNAATHCTEETVKFKGFLSHM